MKRITPLIVLIFTLVANLRSQNTLWQPMNNGMPPTAVNKNIESVSSGSYLYTAYVEHTTSPLTNTLRVRAWDGTVWTPLPPLPLDSLSPSAVYNVSDIAVIYSKVFVAVRSNNITDHQGIMVYDGSQWSQLLQNFTGEISVMEALNGELFVAGDFFYPSPILSNAFTYDSVNFNNLPAFPPFYGRAYDADYINSEYYVTVEDSLGDIMGPISVFKLTGGVWQSPVSQFTGSNTAGTTNLRPSVVFSYNNRVYSTLKERFYLLDNDTAYFLGTVGNNVRDWEEYGGEIYLFGDSTFGGVAKTYRFDGNNLSLLSSPNITDASLYNGSLCGFSPSAIVFYGVTYNQAFQTQGNFSIINGDVFFDINSDCFKNTGEPSISNAIVSLTNQDGTTSSGSSGTYSFSLDTGTYSVDTVLVPISVAKNVTVSCSLPNQITLLTPGQVITQNIAMENGIPTDAQTKISAYRGGRARFGFDEAYKLEVSNTGNATINNLQLTLEMPATVSQVVSSPPPASTSGNIYNYNVLNLQPLETRSYLIHVNIDTAKNSLGDTLKWYAYLAPVNGDADITDNKDTLCQRVVGAYDPNDKQASASTILPGTPKVDYHIRFQNTGSDTAYKVTVVDTLDLTLPMTQIVINSASHPFNLSVINNVLIWEFDNIMLPDSGADYFGSQGYVRFSAGLNPNLGVGDTIENDAQIYFDFQTPVYTNKAKIAIVKDVGLKEDPKAGLLEVFPNPSSTVVFLNWKGSEEQKVQLISSTGQLIDELYLRPGVRQSYAVNKLSSGLYFLKMEQKTHKILVR